MPARLATLALVAGLALVTGVFLGGWLAGTRSPSRAQGPGTTRPPASSELAPALAELARVLAELRVVLEQPRSVPFPAETPAREVAEPGARASHDPELAAALQALAASLRGLERGGAREPGGAALGLVVPAFVDRARAFAGVGLREAQDADDEIGWERAMDAFRKKHLFWTTQQVLDRYGKPDEIEVGDQYSTWSYRLPVGDDGEETYTFYLDDGLVFSAEYSY